MAKKKYPQPASPPLTLKEVAAYEYSTERRNSLEVGLPAPDANPEAETS